MFQYVLILYNYNYKLDQIGEFSGGTFVYQGVISESINNPESNSCSLMFDPISAQGRIRTPPLSDRRGVTESNRWEVALQSSADSCGVATLVHRNVEPLGPPVSDGHANLLEPCEHIKLRDVQAVLGSQYLLQLPPPD